ncbi:MAG: exodeoxyribonuclease V subunit gamma [Kofleriaceae bacterium]
MLRVVHGNHVEALREALVAGQAGLDPFTPTTVAVASRAIGRWITFGLADAHGVALGLELPYLDKIIVDAFARDPAGQAARLRALDRPRLAAALASVLAEPDARDDDLAALATYLGEPRAGVDGASDVRRVQLAQRLARLLWGYAETRADWLDAWDAGGAGPDGPHAPWQRAIYRRLRAHLARLAADDGPRWVPTPRLPAARRDLGLPAPVWPGTLHVVGHSYLAPATLDALTALAVGGEVIVYQLDPCAEFWEDLPSRSRGRSRLIAGSRRRADDAVDDPLALQLWGRPARDTIAALTELAGGDLDARFVDDGAATALGQMLADAAVRAPAPTLPPPGTAAGVRVLACPTPARELEIVAAEITTLLREDPELRAPDIAVLVAGDRDAYLALVPAIFDETGPVPYHVLDAASADRGRLPEAMVRWLDLPGGELTRRDLLGVMLHPHVIGRYPHADPDDWLGWAERLGIYRGADDGDHAGTYLEGERDRFHWDQGLRRLALGAFVAAPDARELDDDDDDGLAQLGGHRLAPEPVAPDLGPSAATFALLARSLIADARWIAATARRWRAGPDPRRRRRRVPVADHARRRAQSDPAAHHHLRAALARPRRPRLGFAEVRELLRDRIAGLRADRGEALVHGVTVAPLSTHRPLPWRHVFIVGLGATGFPAATQAAPYDLRTTPRRGDVGDRDRDRHAFFEAMLGVRDRLTLSYVALHPVSGEHLEPSSVVHELAEAIAPYLGADRAATALAQLTVRHPLHRWSPRYQVEPALASGAAAGAADERDALAVRAALSSTWRPRPQAPPSTPTPCARWSPATAAPTCGPGSGSARRARPAPGARRRSAR